MTLSTPAITQAMFPQAKAPVAVIELKGRPFFIARQVGVALGYADGGRRFPQYILGIWSDRMESGKHYLLLEGDNLIAFREALNRSEIQDEGTRRVPSSLVGPQASSLLLLTEAGLYASILLSKSAVGLALMDFLTLDVLPMIRRCGMYLPSEHPLRPVVLRLAEAGFFEETPDDDPYRALALDVLKRDANKGLALIHEGLARCFEMFSKIEKRKAAQHLVTT